MDIIIGIIFIIVLAIVIGLSVYFILKENKNVIISKSILYFFNDKDSDNLDELIEFSKSNNLKYKIWVIIFYDFELIYMLVTRKLIS